MRANTMLVVLSLSLALLGGSPCLGTDVSGVQTGTWTAAGNPYNIVGDVTVPPGASLAIEAGVQITAQGYYRITVDQALFQAQGSSALPIVMTAADPVTGWRGLRLEDADDASIITGCLVEYARGTGSFPDVRGGAIMARNCSPTISKNTITDCSSHNENYNGCGGGVCVESSDAVISENSILLCTADSGGAIATLEYGTPLVTGNVILDNTASYAGGGLYMGARNSAIVQYNVFMRNHSSGWGGGAINSWTSYIFYGTYATITNNLIAHNTASTDGGGIYCRYDRALLTNNVFVYNHAYGAGGGIYALNYPAQAPQVANCILWANTAGTGSQIYLYPDTGSAISVTYSDVQGGWGGTGNINADPLFVDPDGDDDILGTNDDNFRLAAGSPCIDAGSNAALSPDVLWDLDGKPRYVDDPATPDTGFGTPPIIDMGPFEFQIVITGDVNGDGVVDVLDLLAVIADWGEVGGPADVNGDGIVDVLDLLLVIANWT